MRCKQMLSLSVVTVLLAASLAGCGTSSTAPSAVSSEAPSSAASSAASEVTETSALPDGVYTAEFDTDSGMFHANEACDGKGTLTVKDGKISDVTVGDNSETQGIGSKAIEQLPEAIVAANGTEGVDGVSGATITSKAIFSAVEDALAQATGW